MLSVQNPYNLLNRTYEVGLAEMSVREQSGLLLIHHLLVDIFQENIEITNYQKNQELHFIKISGLDIANQNTDKAIEAYYEIAKKYKLDLAQMSLKFLEIQPFVTSVIIGATTMEQLKTNIESVNINLTEEIINEINEVQKIYPNPCP